MVLVVILAAPFLVLLCSAVLLAQWLHKPRKQSFPWSRLRTVTMYADPNSNPNRCVLSPCTQTLTLTLIAVYCHHVRRETPSYLTLVLSLTLSTLNTNMTPNPNPNPFHAILTLI